MRRCADPSAWGTRPVAHSSAVSQIENHSKLADTIAAQLSAKVSDKQSLLSETDPIALFQAWFAEARESGRLLKEGGYLLGKEGETDAELLSRTLQLAEAKLKERDRYISGLEKENALNALKLSLQAPKVRYFDEVLHSPSTYTVTQIAKELGMSGRELNRRLKALGIQFRQGGTWLLTARYQKEGYTRTHTHSWQNRSGETGTAMHTVWTEKGRLFIHCLFSSLSLF